jgi:hypothetical protein
MRPEGRMRLEGRMRPEDLTVPQIGLLGLTGLMGPISPETLTILIKMIRTSRMNPDQTTPRQDQALVWTLH